MEKKRLFLMMLLAMATCRPTLPMNEDIFGQENFDDDLLPLPHWSIADDFNPVVLDNDIDYDLRLDILPSPISQPKKRSKKKPAPQGRVACERGCTKTTFSCMANLIRHERSKHNGEKPYTCKHCGKKFSLKQNCDRHEADHAGPSSYLCDCGTTLLTREQYALHEQAHYQEEILYGKSATTQGVMLLEDLFAREELEDGGEPRKKRKTAEVQAIAPQNQAATAAIVLSRKPASYSADLTLRTQQLQEKSTCPYPNCDYVCATPQALKLHTSNLHSGTHTCNNCAREFTSRSGYRSHVTRRTCFKPAVAAQLVVKKAKASAQDKQELLWERSTCPECGKVCGSPSHRDDHVQRRHVNVKEKVVYECAVCFKPYTSSKRYKQHMRCHDQPSNNKQQS